MLVILGAKTSPATAQLRPSIGAGVGTVRTERGSSFSAASVSPGLRYVSPLFAFRVSGLVAALPRSTWAGHGRLQFWSVTPRLSGSLRLGGEGMFTGSTRTGGAWTAAAHGLGELIWSGPRWGVGVGAGPSSGWIANDPTRFVALHTRARIWARPPGSRGATEVQASVEPTRFFGAWFTDLGAGVTVRQRAATFAITGDARVSDVYGSSGAGSGSLQVSAGRILSFELAGGTYLREPYQGFPRGRFVSLGVRVGPRPPVAGAPGTPRPLAPRLRGDSVVVRFRFPRARSVAITGSWDGWQTHPLRSTGTGAWEGAFRIARGQYYFTLLVDGRTVVVPAGVAIRRDARGGMVAVLQVR